MTTTDFTIDTRFSSVRPAVEKALREKRNSADVLVIGAMYAEGVIPAGPAGGTLRATECTSGVIYTDIYQGADGHLYVGVSVWYECEGYLEILGEVQIH
jgi:hypothetical protein